MKVVFCIFIVLLCPILYRFECTFESYFFTSYVFDDFFDFYSDGEEAVRLEGVVGVSVDDTCFSYAGLT